MSNYSELDLQILLDRLVKHTADYTKMMATGIYTIEEMTQCKLALQELHIALGKKQANDSTVKNCLEEKP